MSRRLDGFEVYRSKYGEIVVQQENKRFIAVQLEAIPILVQWLRDALADAQREDISLKIDRSLKANPDAKPLIKPADEDLFQ